MESNEIIFLIKWKNTLEADLGNNARIISLYSTKANLYCLVPAKVANFKYPQVVIKYYESIFEWS